MPRIYLNDEPDSPITGIIFASKEDNHNDYPRVIYHSEKRDKKLDFNHLTLVSANEDAKEYLVRRTVNRNTLTWNFKIESPGYLLETLIESELISESLGARIRQIEHKLYEEERINSHARQVYLNPDKESVIEAIFVELDGELRTYIRFNQEVQEPHKLFVDTDLTVDSTSTDFECSYILCSCPARNYSIIELITKLHQTGLISGEFKNTVVKQEAVRIEAYKAALKPTKINADFSIEDFDKKMQARLNHLEQLIVHYSSITSRVKYGEFHGQSSRPIREIAMEFGKIKERGIDTQAGLERILEIAEGMGDKHPIQISAQKCYGLLGSIYHDDQVKLGY